MVLVEPERYAAGTKMQAASWECRDLGARPPALESRLHHGLALSPGTSELLTISLPHFPQLENGDTKVWLLRVKGLSICQVLSMVLTQI